jgi:hypothetical protein
MSFNRLVPFYSQRGDVSIARTLIVAVLLLGGFCSLSSEGFAAMTININYEAGVPAAAQTALNSVKGLYENLFANPITVKIDVQFVAADPLVNSGAASGTNFVRMTYANWKTDLQATSALYPPNTYLSTGIGALPAADPIGNGSMVVRTANARAIGVTNAQVTGGTAGGLNPTYDSTLTFYYPDTGVPSDIWSYNHVATAGRLDFQSFASHELNEALAIGSSLTGLANNAALPTRYEAEDFFRFSSAGVRLPSTNPADAVYFTYDPTLAVYPDRFNQDNANGDRNDWIWGNFGGPAATVEVQNAIGYTGQVAPLLANNPTNPEFLVLSTLGYSVPEPASIVLLVIGFGGLAAFRSRKVAG